MRKPSIEFRPSDLWWLLAFPIYLIVGTLRHEASHALIAVLQGAKLQAFSVLPSPRGWRYVTFRGGKPTWLFMAAPYLMDLAAFLLGYWFCASYSRKRRWILLNVFVIAPLTSIIDSANNYLGYYFGGGDVAAWAKLASPLVVHAYFSITLVLYAVGLFILICRPHLSTPGAGPLT